MFVIEQFRRGEWMVIMEAVDYDTARGQLKSLQADYRFKMFRLRGV